MVFTYVVKNYIFALYDMDKLQNKTSGVGW